MKNESKNKSIKIALIITVSIIIVFFIGKSISNLIAMNYFKAGTKKSGIEAIDCFTNAIKFNSNFAEAFYLRGINYAILNKNKEAIDDFTKVIVINPDTLNYVNISTDLNLPYMYSLLIEKSIESPYICRGISKYNSNDYKGAVFDFDKAIQKNSKSEFAYVLRAFVKFITKDYKGSISDYTKEIEITKNGLDLLDYVSLNNRGYVKNVLGDTKGALSDFNKAIVKYSGINSQMFGAFINRGNIKYIHGNQEGGIDDYLKVINATNSYITKYKQLEFTFDINLININTEIASKAFFKHGINNKNLRNAIEDFSSSIEYNSTVAETYYRRGCARYDILIEPNSGLLNDVSSEDANLIIDDFSKTIEFDPTIIDAFTKRGVIKYKLGNFQGAVEDIISPNDIQSYHARAFSKHKLHYYFDAISDYDKILEFNLSKKNKGIIYYNRGIAKQALGFQSEGTIDLNIAMELGNRDAEKLLK